MDSQYKKIMNDSSTNKWNQYEIEMNNTIKTKLEEYKLSYLYIII